MTGSTKSEPQIVAGIRLPDSIDGMKVNPEFMLAARAIRRQYKPLMDALQKL